MPNDLNGLPAERTAPKPAAPAQEAARSPTRTLLYAGAAVVGGVTLLTILQSRKATATTTTPTVTLPSGQVAVPTQPGLTFRSGSVGGFIPLPFSQLFSAISSIFQPRPGQPSPATELVTPPAAEQMATLPSQVVPEILRSDGTVFTPADSGLAASEFYGGVTVPDILRDQGTELPPVAETLPGSPDVLEFLPSNVVEETPEQPDFYSFVPSESALEGITEFMF